MSDGGVTERPEVSEQDKALAKDWLKRIDAALSDPKRKEAEATWKKSRQLLRGMDGDKRMRTNLHFANLAAMRPQVYAKDPEFSITPTKAVPQEQEEAIRKFAETAEQVVTELLVRRASLKKRAKRILTSAYACSVGWWKICWQEDRKQDPIITNQIKDAQDNLERLRALQSEVAEGAQGHDLEMAQIEQTIQGLQAQPEIVASKGLTNDFVPPDDMLVLDASVREVADYERSEALAHRIWITREQYKQRFGYAAKNARVYREGDRGAPQSSPGVQDNSKDLLAAWEIWEQASGRVFTLCEGEEGFCRDPYSPTWTGKRWYPFFMLAFNEIDGQFYPLSDVELTTDVVREYNKSRDDWERDRKDCLPLNIARKGGTLTEDDLKAIRNRNGVDLILVEGPGGRPISDDIWSGQLANLNPANYDTTSARQDMEMLVGGGDAARGSVLKAKTATEAEILAQGMRGRAAERTDIIEDLLSEAGEFALEICLRKMTAEDVQKIAGPEAVWPEQMDPATIFDMVTLTVRGGSTGKPDRLQEQDRWTKLLPVIEKAMGQVAELRQTGMHKEAEAVVDLVRETLRRFDERIDIERFLPEPQEGEEQPGGAPPQLTPEQQQALEQMQQQLQEATQRAEKAEGALQDKGVDVQVAVDKATKDAQAKIEIARITAPIEAAAAVQVAKVNADAASGQAEREGQQQENAALMAIHEQVQQLAAGLEHVAAMVAQAGAPKPRMKVVHDMDPSTGMVAASRLVPDEQE